MIRVDYGAEGLRCLCLTHYLVPAQGYSLRLPFPAAFLYKPKPHYVLKRAEATLHIPLVGKARIPNLVGEQRNIRFYAENRPCAAGTEGKAAAAGYCRDRRGRIMGSDRRKGGAIYA